MVNVQTDTQTHNIWLAYMKSSDSWATKWQKQKSKKEVGLDSYQFGCQWRRQLCSYRVADTAKVDSIWVTVLSVELCRGWIRDQSAGHVWSVATFDPFRPYNTDENDLLAACTWCPSRLQKWFFCLWLLDIPNSHGGRVIKWCPRWVSVDSAGESLECAQSRSSW